MYQMTFEQVLTRCKTPLSDTFAAEVVERGTGSGSFLPLALPLVLFVGILYRRVKRRSDKFYEMWHLISSCARVPWCVKRHST